jgi:hypothetical protein
VPGRSNGLHEGPLPWKRYLEDLKKKQMDKKEEQRLMEAMRTGDVEKKKSDMKTRKLNILVLKKIE